MMSEEMLCTNLPVEENESECHTYKTEYELFSAVRDYIRENTVNEYMVAQEFDIPVAMVKDWINQGRIEYCLTNNQSVESSHCQYCGGLISFGTICSQCLQSINKKNTSKIYNKTEAFTQIAKELNF